MRKVVLVLLLLSVFMTSCRFVNEFLAGEDGNVIDVPADDAEMNAAIQKAKETLGIFVHALRAPTPTQTHFSVKAVFPYEDGQDGEHMWIGDLSFDGSHFHGILGNEPVYVKNLHYGDAVTVKVEDVTDWIIIDDGKLVGGFTISVLLNQMSERERKRYMEENGLFLGDEPLLP